MKLSKYFLIAALAFAPMMAACSVESAALSLSSTSVQQASTVKAAGGIYTIAAHGVTAYLKSGHATKAQADAVAKVDNQVYGALMAARAADKKGDSPAVGAALAVFNQNYASLAKLVPGLK